MNEELARSLIAEHLAVPPELVTDGALFQRDLGADSLDLIELTMFLETQLGIEIGDEESEHCLTVGDALRLLRAKAAEVQAPA